jgi:hypothetical protein
MSQKFNPHMVGVATGFAPIGAQDLARFEAVFPFEQPG